MARCVGISVLVVSQQQSQVGFDLHGDFFIGRGSYRIRQSSWRTRPHHPHPRQRREQGEQVKSLKPTTAKAMRQACENSGGDYFFFCAVYNRDGEQMAATEGPISKAFGKRVAALIMSDPKTRIRSDASKEGQDGK
jgi:hypothetical protein